MLGLFLPSLFPSSKDIYGIFFHVKNHNSDAMLFCHGLQQMSPLCGILMLLRHLQP